MPQGYKHLDAHARCIIFTLRAEGLSLRAIAARANVHYTTISREIKKISMLKVVTAINMHKNQAYLGVTL